jgi:erythromycin esterase-like protein
VDDKGTAETSLEGFKRFPTWMWRNHDMVKFVKWLRDYNIGLPHVGPKHKVGIYGLDLYSLHKSIAVILNTLESLDAETALRARHRYTSHLSSIAPRNRRDL